MKKITSGYIDLFHRRPYIKQRNKIIDKIRKLSRGGLSVEVFYFRKQLRELDYKNN